MNQWTRIEYKGVITYNLQLPIFLQRYQKHTLEERTLSVNSVRKLDVYMQKNQTRCLSLILNKSITNGSESSKLSLKLKLLEEKMGNML